MTRLRFRIIGISLVISFTATSAAASVDQCATVYLEAGLREQYLHGFLGGAGALTTALAILRLENRHISLAGPGLMIGAGLGAMMFATKKNKLAKHATFVAQLILESGSDEVGPATRLLAAELNALLTTPDQRERPPIHLGFLKMVGKSKLAGLANALPNRTVDLEGLKPSIRLAVEQGLLCPGGKPISPTGFFDVISSALMQSLQR